ncbi:MAG: hypothetical protein Kow0027_30960 [Saprospiraceae bacterium]|nr:MAG: hypothetical protein D6816_17345 [Bacteroidota bacterium]
MKSLRKYLLPLFLTAFFIIGSANLSDAQCPMCRASVESNLKNGGQAGKGLNTGILFMLSMPYLVVGAIGFVWWKNRKPEEE